MRGLALGAFVWRVIGVAAFLGTKQEWMLVAFPNVFENLFLMYVVFHLLSGRRRMLWHVSTTFVVFLAAFLPKVPEEYFLHVLNHRPWDWVHLPGPDAVQPLIWLVLMYLPPFVAVVVLALRSKGWSADGDREVQLSAV